MENKVLENEIDLSEILNQILAQKKLIGIVVGISFVVGLFIAFTLPIRYEAQCRLILEDQDNSSNLSGLSDLAGLAGFGGANFGGQSGTLSPEIYPEIVKSQPFIDRLINQPIHFEQSDTTVSSLVYYKSIYSSSIMELILDYTIGLPKKIKKLFQSSDGGQSLASNDDSFLRYTMEDWVLMDRYKDQMQVDIDTETGILSITATMPESKAAAQVVHYLVEDLKKEIIDYKTEKAVQNLNFVQDRFKEAEVKYESVQKKVANFADRNRDQSNALVKAQSKKLNYDLDFAYQVYNGLASQVEQAKLSVKKETPIFKVLEPIQIPVAKSSPRRKIIMALFIILGLAGSIGYILFDGARKKNN